MKFVCKPIYIHQYVALNKENVLKGRVSLTEMAGAECTKMIKRMICLLIWLRADSQRYNTAIRPYYLFSLLNVIVLVLWPIYCIVHWQCSH